MSFFIKRKLKDGRQIRSRYGYDTNKVLISQNDFEELLNESDIAYEQAKQLQIIIENLQEIKAESIRRALDEIKTEIKEWYWQADKQALAKDPCVVDAMIDLFIRTIDKRKEENKE